MTAIEGKQDLAGAIVHDEIVPARAPWSHHIVAGQTLRIVDLEGNQAVDFLLYSAADDAERYSAQDTVAAQGNLFLRKGAVLRSNEGRAMMTITGSAVEYHDTIGGACSCESNTLRYGHHTKAQHACVDNFLETNLKRRPRKARHCLQHQFLHERAGGRRRRLRHRRWHIGPRPHRRPARGNGCYRRCFELPTNQQSLQRV